MKYNKGTTGLLLLMGVIFLWHPVDNDWKPHLIVSDPSLSYKVNVSIQAYEFRNEAMTESPEWKTKELERLANFVQRRLANLQAGGRGVSSVAISITAHNRLNVTESAVFKSFFVFAAVEASPFYKNFIMLFGTTEKNPNNCDTVKKIVCKYTEREVGFGSEIHDGINCLIAAYATKRTLVIESVGWVYLERGLDEMFLPLSTNCTSIKNQTVILTTDLNNIEHIQIVQLPRNAHIKIRPRYLPLPIPADLADNLIRAHKNPSGWWIGQFLSYLTRRNEELTQFIESRIMLSGFIHPIVGLAKHYRIHVRRTDKQGEARYHDLSEYMKYVEEWFDIYDSTYLPVQRTVYLATDDPNVLTQARMGYPEYTFLTNIKASVTAKREKTRYSESSLRELIFDMEMLSRCDFFVCTLTSSIGRVVYELMHVRYWDAPTRIKSLDVDFTFHHQFLKTPSALENYRQNIYPRNLTIFRDITNDHQGSMVSLDNEKIQVNMPTYPEVCCL